MLKYLVILLALVGCGHRPVKGGYLKHLNDVAVVTIYGHQPTAPGAGTPTAVEPDLRPYYDAFTASSSQLGGVLHSGLVDVEWADTLDSGDVPQGDHTIGLCSYYQYSDGSVASHVQILRQPSDGIDWDTIQLETVVYHELGHCLLGLGHTPDDSHQIMEPVAIMDDDEIISNWNDLVKYEFNSETK